MPYYESVLIARQDLSQQQAEGLGEQFTAVINDNGGKVAKNEYWGLRSLAYRIKKNRKGHYLQLTIDAPAPAIHEMERQMHLNEDLLRHLTIRTDELDLEPSVMMQVRSSRDDRPRRGGHDDRPPRSGSDRPSSDAKPVEAAKPAVESKGDEA